MARLGDGRLRASPVVALPPALWLPVVHPRTPDHGAGARLEQLRGDADGVEETSRVSGAGGLSMSKRFWIYFVDLIAAIGVWCAQSRTQATTPSLRSEHSEPAATMPAEQVAVTAAGK